MLQSIGNTPKLTAKNGKCYKVNNAGNTGDQHALFEISHSKYISNTDNEDQINNSQE